MQHAGVWMYTIPQLPAQFTCFVKIVHNIIVLSLTKAVTKLTSWNRVLEQLRPQLVKKSPAFYGTRRSYTALNRAHRLFVSWARLIQPTPSQTVSFKIYCNIIVPYTPRSRKWPLSFTFPHQNTVCTSPLPGTCRLHCLSCVLDLLTRTVRQWLN
jgi:hypothetical protein